MSFNVEKLYSLLPAVYRIRDIELASRLEGLLDAGEQAELNSLRALSTLSEQQLARLEQLEDKRQRGPLKSLLGIIAEQSSVIEENLDQLYDDLFIETCAEWVVPYIGDLIGARRVSVFPGANFTQRAFVANTMRYRRRKGTASVIEQLARDVTAWSASVVEYFQLLATTQYLNHIRLDNLSMASLRNSESLEMIGSPFDRVARTADVRRIEPRRGRYNIPNIGVFLYRIESFPITAFPAYQLEARRFLFDALGSNLELYNRPVGEDDITHLAEPGNVPLPISRRALHRSMKTFYGGGKAASIVRDGVPVLDGDVIACDLSDSGGGWAHAPANKVAIDPVLGRIAFPTSVAPPATVRVSYRYGFSAELGGGEYGREATFQITEDTPVKVPGDAATIQQGLNAVSNTGGVVEINANDYFFESPTITAGSGTGVQIELRAAEERRPVLVPATELTVFGADESEVTINGLLVAGVIRVPATDGSGNRNGLRLLRLRHLTLAPGAIAAIGSVPARAAGPRLIIESPNTIVEIDHCIVGAIRAVEEAKVRISNSIADAAGKTAFAYCGLVEGEFGGPLTAENSTVIGRINTLKAALVSNSILTAAASPSDPTAPPVRAERVQEGCVRFSFIPPGSVLPRLHRCQPSSSAEAARVKPVFTSLRYGDAGYCQLVAHSAAEIARGADDGAEMGVFHDLFQPQRESNLKTSLDEYLRFGLEVGIFFAS